MKLNLEIDNFMNSNNFHQNMMTAILQLNPIQCMAKKRSLIKQCQLRYKQWKKFMFNQV